MKGAIAAVVLTAVCTTGLCYFAFSPAEPRDAKIDGATDATFLASLQQLTQPMAAERRQDFDRALTALAAAVVLPDRDADSPAAAAALAADPGEVGRRLRPRLHGMTADEVVAAGVQATLLLKQRAEQPGSRELLGQLFGSPATRLDANETAAITTLRIACSAQEQMQACGPLDVNHNGTGEYAFFAELAGAPLRSDSNGGVGKDGMDPAVLSKAFAAVESGRVTRAGYLFQMFLPDARGVGVAEAEKGGSLGVRIDAAQAEVRWCCYAWPTDYGSSGKRAFFVNQDGDVLACSNATQQYGGAAKVPAVTAAFAPGGAHTLADALAVNRDGGDGERWEVVN